MNDGTWKNGNEGREIHVHHFFNCRHELRRGLIFILNKTLHEIAAKTLDVVVQVEE